MWPAYYYVITFTSHRNGMEWKELYALISRTAFSIATSIHFIYSMVHSIFLTFEEENVVNHKQGGNNSGECVQVHTDS